MNTHVHSQNQCYSTLEIIEAKDGVNDYLYTKSAAWFWMPDISLHVYVFKCVQMYIHMNVQAIGWLPVSSIIID